MRKICICLALVALLSVNLQAHVGLMAVDGESRQDVKITTEKVGGNIYVLYGQGGNIGVSNGADGLLMVDDQFAPLADKIKTALKELSGKTDAPRFLINTHWHGDHTGGNEIFGANSTIIAQTNVRKRLLETTMFRGEKREPSPAVALPILTYDDSISVYFNGEEIRAVHYPHAHTDGDTVLFFTKSNAVHMGDHYFAGRFPFVDLESGGSVAGLIENVGNIIKILPADARIIPGHGMVTNLEGLKNYHQTLSETVEIVRKKMKKQTLEQIKKEGLPEKYEAYGSGFIKTDAWIEAIYKSYSTSMKKK